MTGIGFSLQAQYDCPMEEVICNLRQAGFCAVSPVFTPNLDMDFLALEIEKNNMMIQSLHAPHGGLAHLWNSADPQSEERSQNVLNSIAAAARFHIPVVVMHGWQGLDYSFPDHPLDFTNFDRFVDFAGEMGVGLAFENLEGEEYLEALMDRYRNVPHVGYCWDSGHDHCYPHKLDFLSFFGNRLIMTHINDNLGLRQSDGSPSASDDLHFLPFDGNILWEIELERLKNKPRQQILNFEIKKRSTSTAPRDLIYDRLSSAEFFHLAGERAKMIASIYDQLF